MLSPLTVLEYSKKINILYVEDDEDLREATSSLLKNYFNRVDTASDGVEGLKMYIDYNNKHDTLYDMVFTDISMPNMDGITMSKEILSREPEQIIIVTSAHTDYIDSAKEIGINEFFVKPLDYMELSNYIFKTSKAIVDSRSII